MRRIFLCGAALGAILGACSGPPLQIADGAAPEAGVCGNGRVDPGEECDDGNTDNFDGCCNSCLVCAICEAELWQGCTPGQTRCCFTNENTPTECASANDPTRGRCLMPCTDHLDCYHHSECGAEGYAGHCFPVYCGPNDSETPVQAPCTAAGGAPGYCYPQGRSEDTWGRCLEQVGPLGIGDLCEDGYGHTERPRSIAECGEGLCLDWIEGRPAICTAFCDPVAAYFAAPGAGDGCPAGTNCLNLSSLSNSSGKRLADRGLCLPGAADPEGTVACDLITGELTSNRSQDCPDVRPGSACGLFRTGSLMGTCQTLDATPSGLHEACDPNPEVEQDVEPPLTCAAGLSCWVSDPFNSGGGSDTICLQVCDASDPSFVCQSGQMVCTSLSRVEDESPTPLGLCAPAPAQ